MLRPVWHRKQDRVLAHILVCFRAYVLWKFLGQLCHRAGLRDEPRRVLAELTELTERAELTELTELGAVDVVLPTREGPELRTRCVTQPSEHQQILLHHLVLSVPSHLRKTDL